MRKTFAVITALAGLIGTMAAAQAAQGKILTAGALEAGGLLKRIDGGETFDLAIITPGAIKELATKGKVAGGTNVARVGVGVVVKEGAAVPDISSVEAFKT